MSEIDPSVIAKLMILEFLRELMRQERERLGEGFSSVLRLCNLSREEWMLLEQGARDLSPGRWPVFSLALKLTPEDVALRLHESVANRPVMWIERRGAHGWQVLRRPVTSPRALRSGNTRSADLNGNRPALYYELSQYFQFPEEVISIAAQAGYFTPRVVTHPPPGEAAQSSDVRALVHSIVDGLPDDVLPLLERVLDKFSRSSLRELARAYKHFSLSLSQK